MRSSIRTGLFSLACGFSVAIALHAAPPSPAPNGAPAAAADVAVEKDQAPAFGALMDRITRVRESGAWQQAGWKDAELERSIERLIDGVKVATGRRDFTAGVPLADVKPFQVNAGPGGGRVQGSLLVVKDAHVPFADGTVILSDGNVKVSHASGCTIIARGAVDVSHGRGNVILAGYCAQVSHDASGGGRGGGAATGSLVAAGQFVDVSHANGSVLWSPGTVNVSHANGVAFVNCPDVRVSHENGCQRVDGANEDEVVASGLAILPPAPARNPLDGKLTITQLISKDDPKQSLAIVQHGDVELAIRLGGEIRGADGKAIEGLQGWTLSFVADGYALFAKESEFAGFVVDDAVKR